MADYTRAIERAAQRHGVNPRILLAQLRQESGLNPNAVSPKGAKGIAQFMPGTAKSYGVNLNDGKAGDDIDGAARLMADMLGRFHGSYEDALRAYNAGPGAVEQSHGFAETNAYVKKIMGAAGSPGDRHSDPHTGPPGHHTETLPGKDRSGQRQQLLSDYFNSNSRDGLIQLALGLKANQDTPGRTVRVGGRSPQRGPGGAHGGHRAGSANILELFWNGPGAINVKNGQREPKGFVSGHTDHVHVATRNPKGADRLGRLAQRMGLTVRENETFDHVDPVHAPGSYHYSDQAIDVSGPAALERKFAHLVARRRKNKA